MSSGVRRGDVSSYDALRDRETAELAEIRAELQAGEITIDAAQERIVEMVLARTADFPRHLQEHLRRTLDDVVAFDPYFQLVRDVYSQR